MEDAPNANDTKLMLRDWQWARHSRPQHNRNPQVQGVRISNAEGHFT
jgi:hypothetical protein